MRSLFLLLASVIVCQGIFAGELKTEVLDWEKACGGSSITVTTKDGQVVLIEAVATHFAETREWTCPFKAGQMVSATYREYQLIRSSDPDADQGVIDSKLKRLEVFSVREGRLDGMGDALKKDFDEFMRIVKERKP